LKRILGPIWDIGVLQVEGIWRGVGWAKCGRIRYGWCDGQRNGMWVHPVVGEGGDFIAWPLPYTVIKVIAYIPSWLA
jgi:hypothetical protein